jgi:hypothetical protein
MRGLHIHQARSKSCSVVSQKQRNEVTSDETEEVTSQDSNHSTGDLFADESRQDNSLTSGEERRNQYSSPSQQRKERIKWPRSCEEKEWKAFDEDLDCILNGILQGSAERKIDTLASMTHNLGKERFGAQEVKVRTTHHTENRREKQIKNIRKELNILKRRHKQAPEEERFGLYQLRETLREKLKHIRKAERLRTSRKLKAKRRSQFVKDPFKFSKTLLSDEKSGKLSSTQEEIEEHLFKTHCDRDRETPLGNCSRVETMPQPEVPFNMKEPSWKEVQDIVKKARSASAPGPSGTAYSVYKHCPRLLRRLWALMKTLWKKGSIPENWKRAEGCFVPKEKDAKTVEQFRTISLLSVECKIFFSILARRLSLYLTSNQYIDTSAQKGAIPGFSGCIEHTSILSQLIRETKADKGDLAVVWLDFAYAYGGIPHKLIEEALQHYHVPWSATTSVE